jgi:hypothetical protein
MEANQNQNARLLDGWINEPTAMEILNCKKSTLYYLRKKGMILSSRIGVKTFYNIDSIKGLLNENASKPTE